MERRSSVWHKDFIVATWLWRGNLEEKWWACWLCAVLLGADCTLLCLLPHSTPPHRTLSHWWGTTPVTVDINTLLCHWVCSTQKWKYLTEAIYRACRRTGESTATRANLFRSLVPQKLPQKIVRCEDQRQGPQLAHRRDASFLFFFLLAIDGENCCG